MRQSLVIHRILSLNKSLHQLNTNSDRLSQQLKNPAYDHLQTKIMLKHAGLNDYFTNYCGMLLYKIDDNTIETSKSTSKEQLLRQHERLLVEIKTESLLIEKFIISSIKFKELFAKLYKLCAKQQEIIQKEISLLLNHLPNETTTTKMETIK